MVAARRFFQLLKTLMNITDASATRQFVSIVPSSGTSGGGTSVVITFNDGTDAVNDLVDVLFDGVSAAAITNTTATTVTVTTPAGDLRTVDLSVEWSLPNETLNYGAVYTYT